MNDPSPRKLSKAERREQLLETALAIVREQGTDALTLGYLAERAGVSKPIAYEHFKTRSGLLIALYEQIDNRQVAALLLALERTPRRLEEVARVVSTAYMTCFTSVGPEWHAISAALKGDEEMEAFQRELIDSYVALYRDALAPYSKLPEDELRLRCVGIIGAGDAIARDMVRGRIDEAAAAASLASLIVGWLASKA
ncbi:TetR/AcrR family transcriptional regulator [Variovorax sp. MHTC-1]|uniref:TetR/AcrR family transcriptional regulator n=1 Tax=Variovorax sp. MHTC-1 TaxID=2495593 RepID=UPI000F88CF65|nr:TetR/AcrR family transcriptional regulator [Variovorax sp. MHTC-1]RST56539.1 TetR/AcrR family transcriptional regulator [Variovorax sp. MHTC-1]